MQRNHLPKLSAATLAVMSVFSAPSFAADPIALAPVVVTATRQPTRANELISAVDTIGREEIEQAGQSTLLELLALQPGIQITHNGGPGKNSALLIRGTNGNHAVLLIDGVRIGSVTTGQAAIESIPLSQIERIEILRGPASALYGADAVGGVIQIFTQRGEGPLKPEAFVGAGRYGTRQLTAGVSGGENGWSYALRAGQYQTDGVSARKGPYAAYRPGSPSFHDYDPALDADSDGFRATSVGGSLGYRIAQGHELTLNFFRVESRNWYDGGGYSSPGAGRDVGNDGRLQALSVESRNRFSPNWLSTLRIGQTRDESTGFRASNFFNSRQEQILWQNDVTLPVGVLMLGYEGLRQSAESSTTYTIKSRRINAVMAGWTGTIGAHRLQANLRQDSNSQFGDKLTHLLGYGYQITPTLRASASVGSSFKAPTLNDLYYVDSGGNHGDPNLKPERGNNREVALRYEEKGRTASIAYFDNKVTDLIQWDALPPTYAYVPSQTHSARLKGWELGTSGAIGGFELAASVDLLEARDTDTGKRLIRRANRQGRLSVARDFGPVRVGAEWQGVARRFNDAANTTTMGGYGLTNLFAQYSVTRDWRLEARINNVFDKQYEVARGYGTWGVNAFVGVRYLPR